MNDRMTILFCTCDKYKDLWIPFFTVFKNHWKDCNYEILINTETESFGFSGLNIRTLSLYDKTDNVLYGKRMIDHLSAIQTKYTMIVLDDFFLRNEVDESKIDKVLDYMESHSDIECVRLTPYLHRETYKKCTKPVDDFPGYYRINKCAEYKLNFQVCIWDTKQLLKYWTDEDDPWRWEVFANITSFSSDGFLVAGENEGPVLDYGFKVDGQPLSDVYRGKWVKDNKLEELFHENGVEVDFSIRGYYSSDNEPKHFTNINTCNYVLKRIGLINSIILLRFLIINKVKALLHYNHYQFSEYPVAFKRRYNT